MKKDLEFVEDRLARLEAQMAYLMNERDKAEAELDSFAANVREAAAAEEKNPLRDSSFF